jgi:hypothetical protein
MALFRYKSHKDSFPSQENKNLKKGKEGDMCSYSKSIILGIDEFISWISIHSSKLNPS